MTHVGMNLEDMPEAQHELHKLWEAAMADKVAYSKYRAIQVSEAEAKWLRASRDAWPEIADRLERGGA